MDFCQTCIEGTHKRVPFHSGESKRAAHPLDLVHSDICANMNYRSLGGAEYFVNFIDDHSHYTWVYFLIKKSDVFQYFQKWKVLVETASGRKIEVLYTDNGGEYTSAIFEKFLEGRRTKHG